MTKDIITSVIILLSLIAFALWSIAHNITESIIDGALEAAEWMESKLADLPDGYWGHIQVIGGDEQDENDHIHL